MPSRSDLDDPGYTPSRRDLTTVFDWLLDGDDSTAKLAERALLSSGSLVISQATERLERATAPQRTRLVRLMGRLAQALEEPSLGRLLLGCLNDPEPRVARVAVVAVGKLRAGFAQTIGAESALIDRLDGFDGAERRAVIEALGKIGGGPSKQALARIEAEGQTDVALLARAKLRLGRTETVIADTDCVRLEVPLQLPMTVAALHRRGLSEIVGQQLAGLGVSAADTAERRCLVEYDGTLLDLFRSRSMLVPAIVLDFDRPNDAALWPQAVAEVLCQEPIIELLERMTSVRPRLRFSIPSEGHQRAFLWQVSELLSRRTDRLEANPKAALWEIQIERGNSGRLCLVPKRFTDPRFSYRIREISGASHPTIAAALADTIHPHPHDVVWDPFVGSGLELIECARRGAYRELVGTDNNPRALEAAAANFDAAQLERARLLNADARTAQLKGVTAIVTNPPLGIRHQRDGQLWELLRDFLTNARSVLLPLGRLVWLSPLPLQTAQHAQRLGFVVTRRGTIDVGGLSPELQVLQLPRTAR